MTDQQKQIDFVISSAKSHLIDYEIAINPKYSPNWHHRIIAQELEHIEEHQDRDYKFLLVLVPPRSGKSQQCTIDFPTWYLGRNPSKEIIVASYSGELAQDFGGKARALVDSEAYKRIFNVTLKSDEKAKSKWVTQEKGSYVSVGVGGATTGRGANILVIDDPIKNREEAESAVYREKTWDWFTSTAFTRLEPNGIVIIILTRWHTDDLAGRIINNPEFKNRVKVMRFPAIAEEDEQFRKKGEPLWKERYDLEALREINTVVGPYDFASLYQQSPITSENQEFKETWFKKRSWAEVQALDTRKFATIDPGGKEKENDYTGIVRNYVDRQNNWNLKAMGVHFDPKELINYLFILHEEGFEKIGIEETVFLKAIKPFIDDECRKRDKFPYIVPLKQPSTQKEVRIRGLIPRYSSGSIYHIDGECKDLEDQLIVFPKGANDDVPDALAMQLEIAESPIDEVKEAIMKHQREQRKQSVRKAYGL